MAVSTSSGRRAGWATRWSRRIAVGAVLAATCGTLCTAAGDDDAALRATAFLAREVPRWSRVNGCFSCHNNGDAARALFAAERTFGSNRTTAGVGAEAAAALDDTLGWLARPERWAAGGTNEAFRDKRLARLQFASALAAAVEAGRIRDRSILTRAADLVAADQAEDGSWPIDDSGLAGSPAAYGPVLATAVARRTLRDADPARFAAAIARADRYLRARPIASVVDAASSLFAIDQPPAATDVARARAALDLLARGQHRDGGWGPYPTAPTEPFDTALALLSLATRGRDRAEVDAMIARGRASLAASQLEDGGWVETTRPAGGVSYAQRISTAGWAALALIATRPKARD